MLEKKLCGTNSVNVKDFKNLQVIHTQAEIEKTKTCSFLF